MQPNDPNTHYTPTAQPTPVSPVQPPSSPAPFVSADMYPISVQSPLQATPLEPARSKKSKLILAGVAVVVLAGLCIGGYVGFQKANASRAETAARNFILAINAGNSASAYKLCSSNLHKAHSETEFAADLTGLQTQIPKFASHDLRINGSAAVYNAVEANLTPDANGNTKAAFKIALVRSGIVWKVDSVEVQ